MSSFVGRMREYADVSIDRFDGINLESNAYFLSHNHADHTVGLSSGTLRYRLQSERRIKLYCSEVTRHLLLCFDKYKHLADSMVALSLNETCIVSIPDLLKGKEKYKLNVTLLPAGHCPGSVMFLFEGHEETVLYTGDFRLDHGDISQIEALRSGNGTAVDKFQYLWTTLMRVGRLLDHMIMNTRRIMFRCLQCKHDICHRTFKLDRPKELKSLYIDTTFCLPAALFIPSREESSNAVIAIAEEWISQSRGHMIVIKYKALLGYEDLFKRLAEHFKMKVHVTNDKYEQYLGLADLSKFTTPHPEDTQIHACKYQSGWVGKSALPCGYNPAATPGGSQPLVRTIYVSTMAFVRQVAPDSYAVRHNEKSFHVCYSFHSSYGELREVILFLRPHHAFPNVIPMGDTMPQIQDRLNSLAELARRSLQPRSPWQHRELGKLKRKRKWRRPLTQQFEHSENLDFGEPESSPEKRLCSNTRQPMKAKFPLLLGGSDCEDLSTEISTDHKSSSQEKHSSGQDSNYEPTDSEPLNASLELISHDDEENANNEPAEVLEEEKNVMLSFTPTKGGSYGEFAFYVSDDDEEAPGVRQWPGVDGVAPLKSQETCPAKSENGFIVNKYKPDLELHEQNASRDNVADEPNDTTNIETGKSVWAQSSAGDNDATSQTTRKAASQEEQVADIETGERQRNTEGVQTINGAADGMSTRESNAHGEVTTLTTSDSSNVSRERKSPVKDDNTLNMATSVAEPTLEAQSSTEELKEPTADEGTVCASVTPDVCVKENVIETAGDSENTNKRESGEVDTQDIGNSSKPGEMEDGESEKRNELPDQTGKCDSGDTLGKDKMLDEAKSLKNGESSKKAGMSKNGDVPEIVNVTVSPASQKHESAANGESKREDSTKGHVNKKHGVQKKQSSEVTPEATGRHRNETAVNWTDDVIVIDDDDAASTPAAATAGSARWPCQVTVDITCETTDSDATIDPTEGAVPPGCYTAVRPAVRNRNGAVLAVPGLMLGDTTTSTSSDSYTSPGERRRRRRRWRKARWWNSSPDDSSYFHRRLGGNDASGNPGPSRSGNPGPSRSGNPGPSRSGNPAPSRGCNPRPSRSGNPGPSRSTSRLGGDATIDLTSGDDTEAAGDDWVSGDVDTTGMATYDGYYADNEGGFSDASTVGEWDEADSPLFKAKRDHSRDAIASDVEVIVLDDDTSDECTNENDNIASEHDTRTVTQKPIPVPAGVEK